MRSVSAHQQYACSMSLWLKDCSIHGHVAPATTTTGRTHPCKAQPAAANSTVSSKQHSSSSLSLPLLVAAITSAYWMLPISFPVALLLLYRTGQDWCIQHSKILYHQLLSVQKYVFYEMVYLFGEHRKQDCSRTPVFTFDLCTVALQVYIEDLGFIRRAGNHFSVA